MSRRLAVVAQAINAWRCQRNHPTSSMAFRRRPMADGRNGGWSDADKLTICNLSILDSGMLRKNEKVVLTK